MKTKATLRQLHAIYINTRLAEIATGKAGGFGGYQSYEGMITAGHAYTHRVDDLRYLRDRYMSTTAKRRRYMTCLLAVVRNRELIDDELVSMRYAEHMFFSKPFEQALALLLMLKPDTKLPSE